MTDASARILLVEDDLMFARSLERRLALENYEVAIAPDGREGMRWIVTFEPELVVSDWMMPHVDGLELCRAVKTGLGDEAPFFILLTAKDDRDGRIEAFETGADDYLVKPCDSDELLARVRNGVRQRRLRHEVKRLTAELEAARAGIAPAAPALGLPARRLSFCRPCSKVQVVDGIWEDLAYCVESLGLLSFAEEQCPDCAEAARAVSHSGRRTETAAPGA